MAKKRSKRTGGRPRGSKNRKYEYAQSIKIPPSCPACGSTQMQAVRGGRTTTRRMSGVKDGFAYSKITWARHKCSDCGQYIMVQEFFGDGNNTAEEVSGPPVGMPIS